jgi:hypothetical protein
MGKFADEEHAEMAADYAANPIRANEVVGPAHVNPAFSRRANGLGYNVRPADFDLSDGEIKDVDLAESEVTVDGAGSQVLAAAPRHWARGWESATSARCCLCCRR